MKESPASEEQIEHARARGELYWTCMAGCLVFAVSLGVQITVALILTLGPLASRPPVASLTRMGQLMVQPENDIPAYVAGCALTLLLILATVGSWNRYLRRVEAAQARSAEVRSALLLGVLSVLSLLLFLGAAEYARLGADSSSRLEWKAIALLFSPALGAIAVSLLFLTRGPALARLAESLGREGARSTYLADFVVILGVVAVAYIPAISQLAGKIFAADAFFHWDHFIVAPALASLHGQALAADVYSQYGLGWPLLFASLAPILPLSYEHVIGVAVAYATLYYIGLYLLLRAASGRIVLAVAALVLALLLTLFQPALQETYRLYTVWRWPSVSVVRAPVDVWFFLCLFWSIRTGRRRWMVLAGAVMGAGLLLELDTGLGLAIAFAAYGFCLLWAIHAGEGRRGRKRALLDLLASWGAALAVLFLGLTAASQGALFSRPGEFWSGWWEGIAVSSGLGVGSVSFLSNLDRWAIPHFLMLTGLCLLALGNMVIRVLHRRVSAMTLFLGCLGLYGLMRGAVFVGRSIPIYLSLAAIPFCVIAALLVSQGFESLERWVARLPAHGGSRLAARAGLRLAPYVALAAVSFALFSSPSFQSYPSLARTAFEGWPPRGLCLLPERSEICGLSPRFATRIREVNEQIATLRELHEQGHRVAVLDDSKTLLYLEAGMAPWRGDASFFYNQWTNERLNAFADELISSGPDYVLLPESMPGMYRDSWELIRARLSRHYTREGVVAGFELLHRGV